MGQYDRIRFCECSHDIWSEETPKELLEIQQLYVEKLSTTERAKIGEIRNRMSDVLKGHHNDYFLLKWLRARNFELSAAENMLRTHLKWRIDYGVDTIHADFQPTEVLLKYVPFTIYSEDRDSCPVAFLHIGSFDAVGIIRSSKKSDVVKYFILNMELLERLKRRQAAKRGKVIYDAVVIVELENFKLRDFIWKPVLDMLITVLKIFEAQYPESLKKAVVVNTPKVFMMFYAMIKPFLSEPTKKKIVLYGKGDPWKETLLEIIDPDFLPQHWGGNRVDKVDGNPCCPSEVNMGGKVPESYYSNQKISPKKDLKKVTVDKKGTFTVDVMVQQAGSTLNWTFKTKEHDIAFGVSFKLDKNNTREVLPLERSNCHLVTEDGCLVCEQAGLYTLIFDNSFSWYRSKKLYYGVHVSPPEASQQILN